MSEHKTTSSSGSVDLKPTVDDELDAHTSLDVLVEAASHGNEQAFDLVFERLGTSAWAMALCTVDDLEQGQRVLVHSFSDLIFHRYGSGEADLGLEILTLTRDAAHKAPDSLAVPKPRFGRRKTRRTPGVTSSDPYAALAFAGLSEDFRTALWLMEVQHLSSATVSRLADASTKTVEDNLRQARMAFRRYYIEALPRTGLGLECSTALDQMPDYASERLTAADTAGLVQHMNKCPNCAATAASVQDLEGRLIDAMPAMAAGTQELVRKAWRSAARDHGDTTVVDVRDEAAAVVIVPELVKNTDLPTARVHDIWDEQDLLPFDDLHDERRKQSHLQPWWLRSNRRSAAAIAGLCALVAVGGGAVMAAVDTTPSDSPTTMPTTAVPVSTSVPAAAVPSTAAPTTAPVAAPTTAAPVVAPTSSVAPAVTAAPRPRTTAAPRATTTTASPPTTAPRTATTVTSPAVTATPTTVAPTTAPPSNDLVDLPTTTTTAAP